MRRGYLGAHPDLVSPDGPIDVKVVSRTSAAWDGAVPAHYVAQLAAQLACIGASEGRAAILSCHLDHGAELRLAWIEISAGWVTACAESAEAFMEGYVAPGIMPPAWRSAARGVAYPLDSAATVRAASQREQDIITELLMLRSIESRIADLRAELAESLADTPAIVGDDGRRLATYRPEKRTTLDRSAIPADVLSAATTTTEARVSLAAWSNNELPLRRNPPPTTTPTAPPPTSHHPTRSPYQGDARSAPPTPSGAGPAAGTRSGSRIGEGAGSVGPINVAFFASSSRI